MPKLLSDRATSELPGGAPAGNNRSGAWNRINAYQKGNFMKCVLCAKTSIEVDIEPFFLSPGAREMLQEQFCINPDEALANHAICRECLDLPFAERNKLAEKAIRSGRDENCRDLITDALKKSQN
jgi:hypothetical protein